MHIVLENHYAHTDFNPQVSGSNDTLFHGIKCDRIEYVYIYGQISRRALVSDTAFVGNAYTSLYCYCSIWEYGLCNDIEIIVKEMVVVKMRWH